MSTLLYFDIETARGCKEYEDLSPQLQYHREHKCKNIVSEQTSSSSLYHQKAALYAEFGKIVCISCGYYGSDGNFIVQSFVGYYESRLLQDFFQFLDSLESLVLCGHNSKEFDMPYLCRRGLILGLSLPSVLQIKGKKPREILHKDTMEIWKFGDYKCYSSLGLLCEIFDIENPKDDIDGSQVGDVYRYEKDYDRIARYCEKDVWATAQLYEKLN